MENNEEKIVNETNDLVEMPEKRDYQAEILKILSSSLPQKELIDELSNYHESDIAETVATLEKDERLKLYKILGTEYVSEIFTYLDDVEDFLEELSNEKLADIIEEMDADEAIEILDELEEERREDILELIDEETANDIKLIEAYDDDKIGSRMTTNFITIKNSFTIKQAMKSIVAQAAENDNISTIYVVDENEKYGGAFSLQSLIIARSTDSLEDITISNYPFLYADEEVSKCIEDLKDYYEDSIPILNRQNQVIGVITSSELVDVATEELAEDYAKLAGLTSEEDLEEPVLKSLAKRLPWLTLLMLVGLVVSSLIGSFDFLIGIVPILAAFQSMILNMSGNGGMQSLAVTIRVITSNELTRKEKFGLIFKEAKIGLLNGLIIGVVATLVCFLYIYIIKSNEYQVISCFAIASCIGISLMTSMFVASLSGTLIPLFFKKIKIDPAVASGPLITTINDLVAATIYYGLSFILLSSLGMLIV